MKRWRLSVPSLLAGLLALFGQLPLVSGAQPQVPAGVRSFVNYRGLEKMAMVTVSVSNRTASSQLQVHRDLVYGKAGLASLKLDLYVPPRIRGSLRPAVIFIHGGGWAMGDKGDCHEAETLAGYGFVTANINYRLCWLSKFPAQVEDCKAAVRYLRFHAARLGVDPARIGVWGASAGGHLAMMLGCADARAGMEGSSGPRNVSSRVQAVCSYFGPTDLAGEFANPLTLGGQIVHFFMGPFRPPQDFVKASPIAHVSRDDPPLLMVHGDSDWLVPIRHSERMLLAYRQVGVEANLLRVSNADHGFMPKDFRKPVQPSETQRMAAVAGFFNRHLRRAPRPISVALAPQQ
ncbi:MAG: alpha/beta hydrolase [Candidatus Riflebacteria bacterium]|nr:alpha/beta hydrolase [Candidatus Riflebacteria bacterium]